MYEINVKLIDAGKGNVCLKKNVNLWENLDCFILISSPNAWFAENIMNQTLEYLVEKISKTDTYNDFSITLENVNVFMKTWKLDGEKKDNRVDMIIWILNDNEYTFSNIWKAGAYLINKSSEVIELTDNNEYKEDFSYISSWKLLAWEIVVSSTVNLLDYLSHSDLIDGLVLSDNMEMFNKNIQNILESEIVEENTLISSFKIENSYEEEESIEKIKVAKVVKETLVKVMDTNAYKKVAWFFLFLGDKFKGQSKSIKNWILIVWMLVWIFLLYSLLSAIAPKFSQTENQEVARWQVVEIREMLRQASENINNNEIFEKNISDAEILISQIREQKLFLNDLAKITDDINLLKQQFNKIAIFEENENKMIQAINTPSVVKVVKDSNVPYIIDEKSIIWPILTTQKPQIYTFSNLWDWETFIDWVFISQNLYILTNNSKIIRFTKNWHFEYVTVQWQDKWQDMKQLWMYSTSLYTLGINNQVYRHTASWNEFRAGQEYLKEWDLTQIGEILSMAIDWWFYLLKRDLTMVKFFSNPYRVEWIVLNKLPKNYTLEPDKKVDIKLSKNYVYLLLNDKIWVFKPNTITFTDTKSLTYMGQIEGATKKIKDFYVEYDWRILILNEDWLYTLDFEISDDKVLIR